jgi:aspartokinase
MSQDQDLDNMSYDELLKLARGGAKFLIPKLCAALKKENPNYSIYDIRK